MRRIIADSGSTNVDWRILQPGCGTVRLLSPGINPVYMDGDSIRRAVSSALEGYTDTPAEIYFYGAGITSPESASKVVSAIAPLFPEGTSVQSGSDLLGAAIALFGREEGLVTILGTGSNSGLYDGSAIIDNIPAGGFILGDEGSGAYFGKCLLSDYLKREMPAGLATALRDEFRLDYPSVVESVYRGGMPSRYLAGFMEFIGRNRREPYVRGLLHEGFCSFIRRNVLKYGRSDLQMGIVGSVGMYFFEEICCAAEECGVVPGRVARSAGDGLEEFYSMTL